MNRPTTPAPNVAPARPGTLGILADTIPYALRIVALEMRTGHELVLRATDDGETWIVWDWNVGDALGEGPTRELALESAEENAA